MSAPERPRAESGSPASRSRLRPTFEPTRDRARKWRQPGGPWDVGPLGTLAPSGSHLAVVDRSLRLDANAVDRLVGDLAKGMLASGVRRYDVVAWQLPNSAGALLLFWACWRIGAVAAPLHRRLGAAEVEGALSQVDPALIISAADLPASGLSGARVLDSQGGSDSGPDSGPDSGSDAGSGPEGLVALFAGGGVGRGGSGVGRGATAGPTSSDIGVVLFTSGSSGVPKAVLHSHRGLAYKGRLMARVHGLEKGAAVLAPAPLAHVSGLLNGVLISAAVEGPCVLLDPWDPEEGLRLLEDERIAFMGAPPIFFSQMAGLPGFSRERVKALRLISTGGASVSPAFVDSTADSFGCRVKRTYGSTEAPTITTSGPTDPYERARDTDGHPVGDAEIYVRDRDNRRAHGTRQRRRALDSRS